MPEAAQRGRAAARRSRQARQAFAGLMPDVWIDRYRAERIEPMLEELACPDGQVRVLEPQAHKALSGQG